jgi:GntR family transcriptional regulator / MocR family aminotransferase
MPALALVGCADDRTSAAPISTAGGHLERHLRRSRAVYRERHRLLWDALGELLPRGYRLLPAAAGLHITIVRPELPTDRSGVVAP